MERAGQIGNGRPDRARGGGGRPGRFEEVLLPHADLVYRIAVRLTGDAHEAEDLVQETFLRAHRAYRQFELREYGPRPWLLKILHHAFYSRRLRTPRERTLLADIDFEDMAAELEQAPLPELASGQMNWDGFDDELKCAVDRLPMEYRSVLLLWALGDLTYREIAEALDVAIGTVMSRLFRARQMLGHSLAEYAAAHGLEKREPH